MSYVEHCTPGKVTVTQIPHVEKSSCHILRAWDAGLISYSDMYLDTSW